MANSRGRLQGAFSLNPQHAQCLHRACADLDDWPRFWRVAPADILVGQQIVQVLTPFLIQLLDQRLAKAALRRHRDNLWAPGGELIRCRYDDDELAKKHVKDALRQLIQDDGGPLMWPRITEAQQASLDATCRKLNRFLHDSSAADPSD